MLRHILRGCMLIEIFMKLEAYYIKDLMNYNFTWVEPVNVNILNRVEAEQICYGDLGCFSLSYPWVSPERPITFLPQTPELINSQFYLSTRDFHGENRTSITIRPDISINEMYFNANSWTVVLTHGFFSNAQDSWIRDLEEAILVKGDVNLITCDWSGGSHLMNYIQVAANTRVVGAEISRLVRYLLEHNLTTKNKIHLIGQSLGAHVMSYAAKNISFIARLTGLDPAQPGFESAHSSTCLDKSDAQFVDVIHTNAEPFLPHLGLGIMNSVGHIDFFVNGGKFQPGCSGSLKEYLTQYASLMDLLAAPFKVISDYLACSHRRAYQYYIESLISPCSFWARKWNKEDTPPLEIPCNPEICQEMGKFTGLFPGRGDFYVHTSSEPPFCIWDFDSEQKMRHYLNDITNNTTIIRDFYD